MKRNGLLAGFIFVLLLIVSVSFAAQTKAKSVIYLTNSGACPCQKRVCDQIDPLAAHVKNRLVAGIEYKKLDYGVEPQVVDPILKQYKIVTFPAFIVLDAEGKVILQEQGRIDRQTLLAKLQEMGVIGTDEQ